MTIDKLLQRCIQESGKLLFLPDLGIAVAYFDIRWIRLQRVHINATQVSAQIDQIHIKFLLKMFSQW